MLNQKLFESLPGLFLILDINFNVIAATDAYLATTLTKREEIVGKNVFDVFPENPKDPNTSRQRLTESLNLAVSSKEPNKMPTIKYDIQNDNNEFVERWWNVYNVPVVENGNVTFIINSVVEVSDIINLRRFTITSLENVIKNIKQEISDLSYGNIPPAKQKEIFTQKSTLSELQKLTLALVSSDTK